MTTETHDVDKMVDEAKATMSTATKEEDAVENKNNNNDAAIDKAVRFWNHPSLVNVSADEKIRYLKSKGLTNDQIHQAWDKMVEHPAAAEPKTVGRAFSEQQQARPMQQQQQQHSLQYGAAAPPTDTRYRNYPPHYQQQYASHANHEDDNLMQPNNNAAIFLTVGGMLGLGAAAAVRWLNGGDFVLFPPPTHANSSVDETAENVCTLEEEPFVEQEEEEHVFVPTHDDYIVPDDDHDAGPDVIENPLSQQVEELTNVLKSHVSTQERLVQKLVSGEVTDRSMNLLRNKPSTVSSNQKDQQPSWATWAQLVELRAQLTSIQATIQNPSQEVKSKVIEVLAQISSCLQALEKDNIGFDTNQLTDQNDSPSSTRQTIETDSSLPSSTSTTPATVRGVADTKNNDQTTDDANNNDSKITLPGAILKVAEQNDPATLKAGAQLLYLYTLNLSSHPNVPRYRKIYTSNESFQKVNKLQGGRDLLQAVGFVDKGNYLEWQEEGDMTLLQQAAASLSILKSPQQQSNDPEALAKAALAVLSSKTDEPPLTNSDTPQRPSQELQKDEFPLAVGNDDNDIILQTPQPNILVSPPTTKKQILVHGFPEAPIEILNETNEEGSSSILDISSASLEIRPLPPEHDLCSTQLFSSTNDDEARIKTDIANTALKKKEETQPSANNHKSPCQTPLAQMESNDKDQNQVRSYLDPSELESESE